MKKNKKGEVLNFDIYQTYKAFVQETLSCFIQREYDDEKIFEHNGEDAQASWHWEMAKSLESVYDYLLSYDIFREWCDKLNEA